MSSTSANNVAQLFRPKAKEQVNQGAIASSKEPITTVASLNILVQIDTMDLSLPVKPQTLMSSTEQQAGKTIAPIFKNRIENLFHPKKSEQVKYHACLFHKYLKLSNSTILKAGVWLIRGHRLSRPQLPIAQ